MSKLRVGEIAYANVVPLFDAWRALAGVGPGASPPGVSIVRGDPATLNAALRAGEIDLAPCSSIEYARDAGRYRLLPDLSIAADGPVESVLLFLRRPLAALVAGAAAGRRPVVALSPASATSNVLVQVLLAGRGVEATYVPGSAVLGDAGIRTHPASTEPPIATEADAAVAIGDAALLAAADDAARARAAGFPHVVDLGTLWRETSGHPFVFALWTIRDAAVAAHGGAVERLAADLIAAKAAARGRLAALAPREAARTGLPAPRLLRYWERLSYDLGPREQAGLLAYYGLAAREGFIPEVPPLRFVRAFPEPASRR
jgi:chorismate dehydratase